MKKIFKKIFIVFIFIFLLSSCFFDKKNDEQNSNIVVNNSDSNELITDSVKKYKSSLEEKIIKFEIEYKKRGCNYLKQDEVFDIWRAYIFLKNNKRALELTKELFNCNKELYSWINLETLQYLDYLWYILNWMWDKKGALKIYKKLVNDFPSSKYNFVSKELENLFKSEVERLSK